jgi:hypothetical protein
VNVDFCLTLRSLAGCGGERQRTDWRGDCRNHSARFDSNILFFLLSP